MSPATNGLTEGTGRSAIGDPVIRTESTTVSGQREQREPEGSVSDTMTSFGRRPLTERVRYTVTGSDLSGGHTLGSLLSLKGRTPVETRADSVGEKPGAVNGFATQCCELIERMIETEDLIERENLYRTLDVTLENLFELRTSCERPFGHLVVLLLGVTRHTSSESFSDDQLSALKRAIALMRQPRVVETNIRDARRALSRAGFDLFRPFRGVFPDV